MKNDDPEFYPDPLSELLEHEFKQEEHMLDVVLVHQVLENIATVKGSIAELKDCIQRTIH